MGAWTAIGAVAISGTIAIGVAAVGEAAHDAAVARSAADAAAQAAQINGAQLVSIEIQGATTRVVVVVKGVEADAAAERLLIPVS